MPKFMCFIELGTSKIWYLTSAWIYKCQKFKLICSNFVSVSHFHLSVCSKSCETLNCLIKNPELQFHVLSASFHLNCTVSIKKYIVFDKIAHTNIILNYLVTFCKINELWTLSLYLWGWRFFSACFLQAKLHFLLKTVITFTNSLG